MMKKILGISLSVWQVFFLVTPSPVMAQVTLPITAVSALLMDSSGRILYSKNPHSNRAPASTTKILAAIVALDHLKPEAVVTVPSFVTQVERSKIDLIPGEKYYVRDLIKATLVNSANDAAETLAYAAGGGSLSRFADLMNQKVRSLGGKHSRFVRASGLPADNQYSTVYDMTLVMNESKKYSLINQAMKIKTATIYSLGGRARHLKNHNKMLWKSNQQILGKTGWTRKAKHCFVGVIHTSNRTVYVSMLGSRKLWKDLAKLADYGCRGSLKLSDSLGSRETVCEKTKRIQKALKKAGYYQGAIDGIKGPQTMRAIKRFQKANNISQTGHVGKKTFHRLRKYF